MVPPQIRRKCQAFPGSSGGDFRNDSRQHWRKWSMGIKNRANRRVLQNDEKSIRYVLAAISFFQKLCFFWRMLLAICAVQKM
jgi:hypothetical protein